MVLNVLYLIEGYKMFCYECLLNILFFNYYCFYFFILFFMNYNILLLKKQIVKDDFDFCKYFLLFFNDKQFFYEDKVVSVLDNRKVSIEFLNFMKL